MKAGAPRSRQSSFQAASNHSSSPSEASMDNASRAKNRIVSSSGIPSASSPLADVSNKSTSSSADDSMSRKDVSRKPSRMAMAASEGVVGYEADEVRPRIHSRSSLGGRRSLSGAKGAPSALRRLPPGATVRSVVPSLNIGDDGAASTSTSGPPRPAVAALARVNQGGQRRSLGASINAAASGGMAQHDREVREVVKLNVDSTNFEEWMKMATDNKINATNTWNFALIDYFHDMSLLRSDNGDGSINFQKASCTLDGCVKVWTSRVDSVVVETGKLLSGLQDEGKESGSKSGRAKGGEEEEEDGMGEEEDENGTTGKRKRNRAREPTLAKSFAQLAVKKLDLEFTVDPLFKKTSADFDEGGAGGLLMNHLGVDSNARVVFDAGDVAGVGEDDEEEETAAVDEEGGIAEADGLEDQVDLYKLRNKLFSPFDSYMDVDGENALSGLLSDLVICPTFSSFQFAPGDDTPFTALATENAEAQSKQAFAMSAVDDYEGQGEMDEMGTFDDDGQEDAFGAADPFAMGGAEDYNDEFEGGGMMGSEVAPPPNAPIDFTTAFQGITDDQGAGLGGDGFFDYFDQRLTKNWAGPEHWKMRNVGLGALPGQQRGEGLNGNEGAEKGSRKAKEPFVVDFCSDAGAVSAKELFEPAKGAAGITLPQQRDVSSMETYLLPEDRHFTSRQLLRLFIKPSAVLNLKRKGVTMTTDVQDPAGPHPADVDEEYWARSAAAREASQGGEGETPFDTPFFHDAEDDGGFDGLDEGAGMDLDVNAEEDEELATQALKRIRPEFVNYAKKAKRVDVRKLKENIWKHLEFEGDGRGEGEEEEEREEKGEGGGEEDEGEEGEGEGEGEEDESATPRATRRAARVSEPLQPRTFQSVLAGLKKMYPKDRMDEISTSFCFICLLHLANEEGLQISTGGLMDKMAQIAGQMAGGEEDNEMDDLEGAELETQRSERLVGFLEQLSIAKDPNAGQSA